MPAPDYLTEIAQLEAGLASGEARIESDGDSVTYRGIKDIQAGIAYFRERAASSGTSRRPCATLAVYRSS